MHLYDNSYILCVSRIQLSLTKYALCSFARDFSHTYTEIWKDNNASIHHQAYGRLPK